MTSLNTSFLEKNWGPTYALLVALVDVIVVAVALAIGYAVNFPRFSFQAFVIHQWKLVVYSVVLFVGFCAVMGVYRRAYYSLSRIQIAAAARAYALSTLIIFATLFLFRNTYYSTGALLTFVVILPAVYLASRLILGRIRNRLQGIKWGLERTVVVLLDKDASDQLRRLAFYPSIGFDVRSVIDASLLDDPAARRCIQHDVAAQRATCIIFSSSSLEAPRLLTLADEAGGEAMTIRVVSPEIHDALTLMRLYDFGGVALWSSPQKAPGRYYGVLKRGLDIVISAVLIVLTAPVVFLIALAIRTGSAGPVFFRQVRSLAPRSTAVGVFKFRSMVHNAEDVQNVTINGSEPGDEVLSKSPADPRVTPIGRMIRKYSLDELPQLYNVIAGQMSLVGPRPLPMSDFGKLQAGGIADLLLDRRTLAKPGLTGLWQISGRSGLSLVQMVILDLYYSENQSFLFDLEILFETIPAVVTGRGAY